MPSPKLLFVEDNETDLATFRSTVERYSVERKDRNFEVIYVLSLDDAHKALNNSFDGAIIDLKLNGDSNAGNVVIDTIVNDFRIPITVFTGTPENVEQRDLVKIYKKGESQYDECLDVLFEIYQTGLTRILGGRGILENTMDKVFWKNILPTIEIWKTYNSLGKQTEEALLRYTLSHIIETLTVETEYCFPEEVYIAPPISENIKTGCIVKKKGSDGYYVVLSPSCDLAMHDGKLKTDRIMICTIENIASFDDSKIKNMKRNSFYYYHYLPATGFFSGGFINFRNIETYSQEEYFELFEQAIVQISGIFIKDIVSRFSSYYARQGQPDVLEI